ncbi:MAG: ATP-binding protein, partial [Rhodospirillaceae bacterium]
FSFAAINGYPLVVSCGTPLAVVLSSWYDTVLLVASLIVFGLVTYFYLGSRGLRQTEELIESEARSRSFLRHASDGIHIIDTQGNIIEASDSFCRMLGYTQGEMMGLNVIDFDAQVSPAMVADTIARLLESHEVMAFETRHRRKDGGIFDVEVTLSAMELSGQSVIHCSSRNITERKQAEEKVLEASRAAIAANRAKSEFLAMMSHELRTPMTGVIGMADFLRDTPLNKDQKTYVDTIRSSAKILHSVLNDVLDYSKIEANKLTLETVEFDAVQVAVESARLFWSKAEENGCTMSMDWGDQPSLSVKGDPIRIKQVLGNLISNAEKFTKNGEVIVRVRNREEGDRLRLRYEVEDTGIGISDADIARLFVPFVQAGDGTARKYGGTGLGLSICKRLVELMGGEITVSSQLGRGSIFCFTCLVEKAAPAEQVTAPPLVMRPTEPLDILVAEDNRVNRLVIKTGLEQRRHKITMVENGVQALAAASSHRFDVILMDIQMPEMDGDEATRQIRMLSPPYSDVPIVALSADAISERRAAYMRAGLTHFLTKPIEWSEVDAVLSRIQGWTATREQNIARIDLYPSQFESVSLIDNQTFSGVIDVFNKSQIADFINDITTCCSEELREILLALNQGDVTGVHRYAHAIYGMFINIGGIRAAACAKQINNNDNLDNLYELYSQLRVTIRDTIMEFSIICDVRTAGGLENMLGIS